MDDPAPLTELSRRTLHRGAKFAFEQIELDLGNGNTHTRDIVRHPGAVVILPLLDTPEGRRVVYLRNFRAATGGVLTELPAGTLEPPEAPAVCAHRELIEEAGYDAATITPLGRFHTTPGMTDELMHAFVATDLHLVDRAPEPGELMTVHQATPEAMLAMIDDAAITDAKTMLALLIAERRGWLEGRRA